MTQVRGYGATVPLDGEGRVCVNARCLNCGYNLRTLSVEGLCPECGRAVRHSAGAHLLRFADPRWVRRLSRGALLLAVGLALAVVSWLALVVLVRIFSPRASGLLFGIWWARDSLVVALVMAGVLLMTGAERVTSDRRERVTARRVARWCLWFLGLAYLAKLLFRVTPLTTAAPSPLSLPWQWVAELVTALEMLGSWGGVHVLALALLLYLKQLMRRIPSTSLPRYAGILFWVTLAVSLATVAYEAFLVATRVRQLLGTEFPLDLVRAMLMLQLRLLYARHAAALAVLPLLILAYRRLRDAGREAADNAAVQSEIEGVRA